MGGYCSMLCFEFGSHLSSRSARGSGAAGRCRTCPSPCGVGIKTVLIYIGALESGRLLDLKYIHTKYGYTHTRVDIDTHTHMRAYLSQSGVQALLAHLSPMRPLPFASCAMSHSVPCTYMYVKLSMVLGHVLIWCRVESIESMLFNHPPASSSIRSIGPSYLAREDGRQRVWRGHGQDRRLQRRLSPVCITSFMRVGMDKDKDRGHSPAGRPRHT